MTNFVKMRLAPVLAEIKRKFNTDTKKWTADGYHNYELEDGLFVELKRGKSNMINLNFEFKDAFRLGFKFKEGKPDLTLFFYFRKGHIMGSFHKHPDITLHIVEHIDFLGSTGKQRLFGLTQDDGEFTLKVV